MAATKKRPAGRDRALPPTQQPAHGRTPLSVGGGEPSGPCKVLYHCPLCGHPKGDATWKADRDGRWRWFVGCFSASCQALGRGYPAAAAVEVGAPHGAAILEDPLRWLAACIIGSPGGADDQEPEELPSVGSLAGAASRLWSDPNALGYLRRCGLAEETIRRYQIGRVDGGFWFPVVAGGELVNVVTHRPEGKPKYATLRGRSAAFYPGFLWHGVLLCAGVKDVLVARQHGLRYAVTTTCGATLPGHLVPLLSGRPVAVAYDTGEDEAAERTAARLRAAGGRACVVRLGLPENGDDLTDWFVKYGRTAKELKRLIRASWRAA